MKFEALLDYLELEEASEFEYFENLADLVEADMEIEPELIYKLLEAVDLKIFAELVETYFEDVLNAVPEEAMELYTLLDSLKMALMGMARNIEEEKDLVLLSDEFSRFRSWYSVDSKVWVRDLSGSARSENCVALRDALTLARMEALGGEKYEYYFDEALNFELDQYTMSFADLIQKETAEGAGRDAELEEMADVEIEGLEYTDQIFTPEKLH
ncbi:hypothetical protein LI177_09155 [bacterium 210820-DFI.6.37]|nr:hypothetical protein [bacterium 210820-DFI.6.37]